MDETLLMVLLDVKMRPFFSAKVHCGPWVVVVNIIEHDEMEKWLILVFGFGIKNCFLTR